MTRFRLTALTVGYAVIVLAAVSGIRVPSANAVAGSGLSPADFPYVGIVSASDVTNSNSPAAPGEVSRSQAVQLAQDELGISDAPISVWRGEALRYADEPAHDAWIVIFAGGVAPADGPVGAGFQPTVTLTGIVIDAQSGEFLHGFMR